MAKRVAIMAALLAVAAASETMAQTIDRQVLSASAARTIVEACEAEAGRNGWLVSIAVVDEAGNLVRFARMDGAGFNTIEVSQRKARTSVILGKPSKVVMDRLLSGENQMLGFPNVVPMQGALPITVGGRTIAAVGVSGAASADDERCAQAGLDALQRKGG